MYHEMILMRDVWWTWATWIGLVSLLGCVLRVCWQKKRLLKKNDLKEVFILFGLAVLGPVLASAGYLHYWRAGSPIGGVFLLAEVMFVVLTIPFWVANLFFKGVAFGKWDWSLIVTEIVWMGLVSGLFGLVVGLIVKRKSKSLKDLSSKWIFLLSWFSGMVLATIFLGTYLLEVKCTLKQNHFHVFNGHLKDVCSEEKWSEQCPRSLVDLRNFDPPRFDELSVCSKMSYSFDDLGRGTFVVRYRNTVLVSDNRYEDRWARFLIFEFKDKETYTSESLSFWDKFR